jgi:hypothetical protein
MSNKTQKPTESPQPQLTKIEQVLLAPFVHRNSWWMWLSVFLLVVIYYKARHMVDVALFKLALITIATYVGYLASLAMEGALGFAGKKRRKRPHEYQADALELRAVAATRPPAAGEPALARAWELEQLAAAMLWRRAMIVSAAMIAAAMGG